MLPRKARNPYRKLETARQERLAGELRPKQKPPTCPSHLCPPAKAEWKRLAAQLTVLRILTELDRAALAAYCQAYGRWVEAERKLHETPMLLKLPSGYVQQNPWLTIANKQLELMHKYLSEFGLSPVSRSRVSLATSGGPSKFAGLLGQRPWIPADEFLTRR
jgi:P27 family predicted phage terminase small subunit